MRVVVFCHSLVSDWNHGNAHFLRGVAVELQVRGCDLAVYEPADAWSAQNLRAKHSDAGLEEYRAVYPSLRSTRFDESTLDLDEALRHADLVLVHEWNSAALIHRIGCHHRRHKEYKLFFHDTHHRAVSDPESIASLDLSGYDGALVFGESLRPAYQQLQPGIPTWAWHEAADVRVFRPIPGRASAGDIVWIGNWGDDERSEELCRYLLSPARRLQLSGAVYGVRYPEHALAELVSSGLEYCGWLPNYQVPHVFAQYAFTVHVPRRFYTTHLPGIPTIRVFEALACGIPLICAPWDDTEGLFTPGEDYLVARDTDSMCAQMQRLTKDIGFAAELADRGRRTILDRHTCAHRVDELMEIAAQ